MSLDFWVGFFSGAIAVITVAFITEALYEYRLKKRKEELE